MGRTELRISGFGGQGIIFLAYVTGRSVAIGEGRHATLNQSFGPEARGSACSAQLIVDDKPVDYPYLRKPSILVSMSQDAYRTYLDELDENGTILIDEDLVKDVGEPGPGRKVMRIPATRFAESLGKKICANMVMCGFLAATTDVMERDSAREAIEKSVPPGLGELNLKAFDLGYEHGEKVL
jgi:2-oxoglutarate ferredoxin oxidoreductase subunit gamma